MFTAYAAKHYFSDMEYLDIVDCNGGDHGKAFATNFNPEINIREITQNGRYYEDGKWVTTGPLEIHKTLTYPNIGERESYLLYHEELESLVKNYPSIKRARFWMTFGQEYLTHLRVIQNIGMARIDEVEFNGQKIVPLQFLKAVLPNPQDLGENYHGETSIGCRIEGLDKEGKHLTYYIWNNCSHEEAYRETGMQAVSYTTGVPAMVGAMMLLTGKWNKAGVYTVEQLDLLDDMLHTDKFERVFDNAMGVDQGIVDIMTSTDEALIDGVTYHDASYTEVLNKQYQAIEAFIQPYRDALAKAKTEG